MIEPADKTADAHDLSLYLLQQDQLSLHLLLADGQQTVYADVRRPCLPPGHPQSHTDLIDE